MTTYYNRNVKQVDGTDVAGTWTGLTQGGTAGSADNDGGIVRRGGTIVSSRWTSKAIAENVAVTGPIVYNSSALAGNRKLVDKAVSAGSFATMTAGEYVMRRVTTELAGVANTTLKFGASDYGHRRSIHRIESWRTSFLSSFTWEAGGATIDVPGSNLPTYTLVTSNETTEYGQNSTATSPASQGTQDIASRPTIAIPGQLVYKTGKLDPIKDVYKARTMGS